MPENTFETNRRKKLRCALISIAASVALIALKLTFGIITNSVSILASAVDSFLDLSASSVNYFSIRKSVKPADTEHKFGHGKAEGLAGLFQCFIIGVSSLYLIYLSFERIIGGAELRSLNIGIAVIGFSIVASLLLARYIQKVANETDSIALKADSLHFRVDVYVNFGIVLGLIIIKVTGSELIDPLISLVLAGVILWTAKDIVVQSIDILMDRELPEQIVADIEEVIFKYRPEVKSYHKMRTRNAGSKKFIEFHLVLDHTLSFVRSHEIAEEIIKEIETQIPGSELTVHVDPDQHPDYS